MKESVEEICGRIHHGRNITRTRKIKGVKQSALAIALGMSQQAVSRLEQKARIDDEMLKKIAKILEVPVDILKEMEEDPMMVVIENNDFHDNTNSVMGMVGDQINNSLERITELEKENKDLYERLLKAEQEKNEYLEKLVRKYEEGK